MRLPCGRHGRAGSCPLMSITAPQKHLDWPLASCEGNLHPESHIAYFHAVQARCFRYSSKSASVRLARKTSHANSKSPRAFRRRTGGPVAGLVAWIEAAAPPPLIGADRVTRTEPDRSDVCIAIVDQPALLSGMGIAAAGEGGHGRYQSAERPEVQIYAPPERRRKKWVIWQVSVDLF
jgi:hypothetical protein